MLRFSRFIGVLLLTLAASSAFCFPDMRNYHHEIIGGKGNRVATTPSSDYFNITRYESESFIGYTGYCKITGYTVDLYMVDGRHKCSIYKRGQPTEKSQSCYIDNSYKGVVFQFYDFPDGCLQVCYWSGGKIDAGWLTWIRE